jgi:hypothetical protein
MILNGSPMSLWASDQYLDNKASWIAYEETNINGLSDKTTAKRSERNATNGKLDFAAIKAKQNSKSRTKVRRAEVA